MRILDYIKNLYIAFRLYKVGRSKNEVNNMTIIFFEDGYGKHHPGLMDRMKAIVGVYYIAKKSDIPFKIVFSTPFLLDKYLEPNKTDWKVDSNDISYRLGDVHFFGYCLDKKRSSPKLNVKKQNHCYLYQGYVQFRSKEPEWQSLWRELYHELFKRSAYLESLLEQCGLPENYISVHIRFINILEKFENGHDEQITKEEKKILLEKIFRILEQISLEHKKEEIYIFSDSRAFITEALKSGYRTVMPEKQIGHISFCHNEDSYDKTFIDFYAMAESQKIYSIQGGGLYASVFSYYAAVIGRQNYQIIDIGNV